MADPKRSFLLYIGQALVNKNKLPKNFQCNICSRTFPGKYNLYQHKIKVHKPGQISPCTICDQSFYTKYELRLHINTQHNTANETTKKFKCKICGETFPEKFNLDQHNTMMHKPGKINRCRSCDETFLTNYDLKLHKNVCNMIPKNISCEICEKKFPGKPNLYQHKRVMHKQLENKKPCKLCGKTFSTKYELTVHTTTEHGKLNAQSEAHFKCENCSKVFKGKPNLKQHMRYMHTRGIYQCKFCEKSFLTNDERGLHKNVHTYNYLIKEIVHLFNSDLVSGLINDITNQKEKSLETCVRDLVTTLNDNEVLSNIVNPESAHLAKNSTLKPESIRKYSYKRANTEKRIEGTGQLFKATVDCRNGSVNKDSGQWENSRERIIGDLISTLNEAVASTVKLESDTPLYTQFAKAAHFVKRSTIKTEQPNTKNHK